VRTHPWAPGRGVGKVWEKCGVFLLTFEPQRSIILSKVIYDILAPSRGAISLKDYYSLLFCSSPPLKGSFIMTVRVVFFDLGDTLVEIAPDVLEDSARQITILTGHPVSAADLKKAMRTEWLEWATRPQELLQVETEEQERRFWEECFYPSVLKRLGVFSYPPHLVQFLTTRAMDPGSFVLFPEVEEV